MFRISNSKLNELKAKDDGVFSPTLREQKSVEEKVEKCFQRYQNINEIDVDIPELERHHHTIFLTKGLEHLTTSYECLDASRPWMCYWILHALEILESLPSQSVLSKVVQFLSRCQSPTGGFAGGPGQQAHLAPTYAAINALCIIGTEEAYQIINREKLLKFLIDRKRPDGSFELHEGGEVDIRGSYCAATVARLTNIPSKDLFEGCHDWVLRCQNYDGGFAGYPGLESHGGYSFCGLATLVILGKEQLCDLKSLLWWTVCRQMSYEGGFQGRTNKLVDGCYSFWQGAALPIIHRCLSKQGDPALSSDTWMFHQRALQEYLLMCCQHTNGGLVDKPGKSRDYYHTCYCLSGLSIAQHFMEGKLTKTVVVGPKNNEVLPSHPVFNISLEAVSRAHTYFNTQPEINIDSSSSVEK